MAASPRWRCWQVAGVCASSAGCRCVPHAAATAPGSTGAPSASPWSPPNRWRRWWSRRCSGAWTVPTYRRRSGGPGRGRDGIDRLESDLAELAEDMGAGRITRAEWMAARGPLLERIDTARAQAAAEAGAAPLVGLTRKGAARKAWPDLELSRQQAILDVFVDAVVIARATRRGPGLDVDRVDVRWRSSRGLHPVPSSAGSRRTHEDEATPRAAPRGGLRPRPRATTRPTRRLGELVAPPVLVPGRSATIRRSGIRSGPSSSTPAGWRSLA